MIQEYALDPDLVVDEYLNDKRFFNEAFGPTSIRFLSCFPKRWRQEVIGAIKKSGLNDDVLAKKAILSFVDGLLGRAIKREHSPLIKGEWLEKAEHENGINSFHAILTGSNPNGNDDVVEWREVPGHSKWNDPRVCHPKRTAAKLAAVVKPLLMRSREVIFVDPYFDIVRGDFQPVFEEYFKCVGESLVTTNPRITLVTGLKGVLERGVREPSAENVAAFVDDCNQRLPGMLPQGCECTVAILKERRPGQQLHNRFILTKNVAIKFGIGLGCLADNTQSCDDLDVAVYKPGESPWELYNLQRQPPAFELVRDPFVVTAVESD